MKIIYLLILCAFCGFTFMKAETRKVNVNQKSGDIMNISFEQLDKITFSQDNVIFNYVDKTSTTMAMDDIRSIKFDTPSGIEENLSYSTEISVYPNPATELIYLKCSSKTTSDVRVYSVTGALIRNIASHDLSQPVDVKDLSTGIYFISTGEGMIRFIKK